MQPLYSNLDKIAGIDWVICLGYLGLVVGLGLYFSNKQKSNDDFFLGGRNMHWLPVGLSLFATTFSSNSFVGLPAEGAFRNYHQLLAILFIPLVVIPITCIWFIPFYKRFEFVSLYEYLERRFHRQVRLSASIIYMIYSAGWMATMLLAVTRILNVVLDAESAQQTIIIICAVGCLATLYTAMGGVKAVIWTDTVQAFALGGGMIFLFWLLLSRIDGGWSTFVAEGQSADKFEMFGTGGGFGERNIYSACAYGFFVYMGGQLASFGAYQRYITVDTISDARRALVIKAVFTTIVCTLFFLVGTGLYVFYQQSFPDVFASFSSGELKDKLLPHFVVHHAGGFGMLGLLLAGLFAAAMSSLDSGINSMTASLVTDWMHGKERGIAHNRFLTGLLGLAVTGFACLLSQVNLPVFDILLSIAGATLGLLLAVLMMGMLIPRMNTEGVVGGLIVGILVFVCIRMLIPTLSDEQLAAIGPFAGLKENTWWDGMFTTIPCVVFGCLFCLFAPPPKQESLNGLLLTKRSPSATDID